MKKTADVNERDFLVQKIRTQYTEKIGRAHV